MPSHTWSVFGICLLAACATPADATKSAQGGGGAQARSGVSGTPAARASASSGTAGCSGSACASGKPAACSGTACGGAVAAAGGCGGSATCAPAGGTVAHGGSGAGGCSGASCAAERTTLHNGGFWNDVRAQRIEAHGGGFLQVEDTFYWFGEDKSANSAGFKGVNCYASRDLSHWELRAAVVTRDTAPELAASDRIIERPKVIYNPRTQRYVMWLHWEGKNYAEAKAGVFSSAQVDGPYTFHAAFRPNDNMSRDDTLFQDDDGKAYFLSAANENADLVLYELSDDYLSVARQLATLFAGSKREAPALFKDRGRYYLITSAATGWDPNQAKYTTASAIAGPWAPLQNLGDATTFDTQPTYVIPIRGSQRTTYVYAGDRWQDPDLQSSKYIWLPLELPAEGQLRLGYHADWQLDLGTGEWSTEDGFLPQQGWKLLRADSEETAAENGSATRAFDGRADTFWHTQYTDAAPAPPHELQIDLGARYSLTGMRYLPRQDANDHGLVSDYELYVSDDPGSWQAPVSSGKLAASFEPKRVDFAAHSGRYVRFVARSEVQGRAWTSMAELDLSGTPE